MRCRTSPQLARHRFTRPTAGTAAAAEGLILTLGGFIFYNTNVLNEYDTVSDRTAGGGYPRHLPPREQKCSGDRLHTLGHRPGSPLWLRILVGFLVLAALGAGLGQVVGTTITGARAVADPPAHLLVALPLVVVVLYAYKK